MSQTDIDTVIPTPHTVTMGDGSQIEIKPVKVGKLPQLMLVCRPLYDDLKSLLEKSRKEAQEAAQEAALAASRTVEADGEDLIVDFTTEGTAAKKVAPVPKLPVTMQNVTAPDVYAFTTKHVDTVLDVVALLVNKPRAWVDELDINELIELFIALVEVNLDFFIQRLLPLLSEVAKELVVPYLARMRVVQSGPTPSTVSSDPATDTPT